MTAFLFLIVYMVVFLHYYIKTPVHPEAIRRCESYEFFTSDFTGNCEDIQ